MTDVQELQLHPGSASEDLIKDNNSTLLAKNVEETVIDKMESIAINDTIQEEQDNRAEMADIGDESNVNYHG